jgi:hypothetical protein
MKKKLFLLFFLGISVAQAQENNFAMGFRVGEPFGITARKYFNYDHSFELNFGTYGFLYRTEVDYRKGSYESPGMSLQGHYLWNKNLDRKGERFWAYYGFGGQMNRRVYRDKNNLADRTFSFGPSGTAGLEYFRPNDKFSIFFDVGMYLELAPRPLFWNPAIGGGVRVNMNKLSLKGE